MESYKRAKYAKNSGQAYTLMNQIKETAHFKKAILGMQSLAGENSNIILAPISSLEKAYDPRTNKAGIGNNPLPMAIALAISDATGWDISTDIVQTNIVGHTGATVMERMAHPATFSGKVEENAQYIIIDDHVSSGATVANCRGHIESNGGKVMAVSALTANRGGMCLRMTDRIRNRLTNAENFSTIGCHTALSEKNFGYPIDRMTNSEGIQVIYGIQEGKEKKGSHYNLQSYFNDIITCRKENDLKNDLTRTKEQYAHEKRHGQFMPTHGRFSSY